MSIAILMASTLIAQEPSKKIEQLHKDPLQKERAAKADVLAAKDQVIYDSTATHSNKKISACKRKGKKRSCHKKQ